MEYNIPIQNTVLVSGEGEWHLNTDEKIEETKDNIPTQSTVSGEGKWRLKTDEEIEEMNFRPWVFNWGSVVDDGTPRKYKWLYRPCCCCCCHPSTDVKPQEGPPPADI